MTSIKQEEIVDLSVSSVEEVKQEGNTTRLSFVMAKASTAKKSGVQITKTESKDFVLEISNKKIASSAIKEEGPIVIPYLPNTFTVATAAKKAREQKGQEEGTTSSTAQPPEGEGSSPSEPPKPTEASTAQTSSEPPSPLPPPPPSSIKTEVKSEEIDLDKMAEEELKKDLAEGRMPSIFADHDMDEAEQRRRHEFQKAMAQMSEDTGEEYGTIPIEEFGKALLAGMGWKPGMGIGRGNEDKVVEVRDVERRQHRLGLGATARPPSPGRKRFRKPGDPKPEDEKKYFKKGDMGPGSLVIVMNGPHEGLYARVNVILSAVAGKPKGTPDRVKCTLDVSGAEIMLDKGDVAIVDPLSLARDHPARKFISKLNAEIAEKEREREIEISSEDEQNDPSKNKPTQWGLVDMRKRDQNGEDFEKKSSSSRSSDRGDDKRKRDREDEKEKERDSTSSRHKSESSGSKRESKSSSRSSEKERPRSPKKEKIVISSSSSDRDSDRERDSKKRKTSDKSKSSSSSTSAKSKYDEKPTSSQKQRKDQKFSWVVSSNLVVRVVDRTFGGGKYYCHKGVVMDIVSPFECVLRMEDGRLVEGVTEQMLETVIPKQIGSKVLIVRGSHRGASGTIQDRDTKRELVHVRLSQSVEIVSLPFDDVCEYVGGSTTAGLL